MKLAIASQVTMFAAATAVIALTALSGVVDGRMTNRWGVPPDFGATAGRIAAVPAQFGDWQLRVEEKFDPVQIKMLECGDRCFSRMYINTSTGDQVSVALIAGRPGPIAVHTPEICYSSRNYSMESSPLSVKVRPDSLPEETFWKLEFRRRDLERTRLHVAYAWNTGDGWRAFTRPRWQTAGKPLLYKLQLASESAREGEVDPCSRFLSEFLPVLDQVIFSTNESAVETSIPQAPESSKSQT